VVERPEWTGHDFCGEGLASCGVVMVGMLLCEGEGVDFSSVDRG